MSRPRKDGPWYEEIAERMVREGISLEVAATKLGLALGNEEIEKASRHKEFQRAIWAARNRYYSEIANEPSRGKATLIGMMCECIQKLMKMGEFKDAVDGILKLARVEGHVGGETEVSVFQGLTAKELDEVRHAMQTTLSDVKPPGTKVVSQLFN